MENKRFLKIFGSRLDYESQKESVMGEPYVVLLEDTQDVIFYRRDYSKEYFTIENTGSEALTFQLMKSTTSQTVSYMDSESSDWVDTSDVITVAPQSELKLKGAIAPVYSYGIGTFNVSGNTTYNVKGNVMSLLYGDEFSDKIDLTGKDYAFYGLFINNEKLVDSLNLILPATTLDSNCYQSMFAGCTSLVSAPKLPATTLADRCYQSMFAGCTSLVSAPELPATTLADYCYFSMFEGCTSLVSSPELPANTLVYSCYQSMFQGCTSLVSSPELPATTLVDYCYSNMFKGCTSLVSSPELPATTLANYCYYYMFQGCSKLNHITMLATDISATRCLTSWVSGVASSGTFVKHPDMTSLTTGDSGIPTGWTVEDYNPYSKEYFTIEAIEDGLTVSLYTFEQNNPKYRIDNGDWVDLGANTTTPSVNTGQKIQFKMENPLVQDGIGRFEVSKQSNVSGNIMSLLYGDDFEGKVYLEGKACAFSCLFIGNPCLINAENLILPATTLAEGCYSGMFNSCSSLTTAPALPATTLVNGCYSEMFVNCSKLNHITMLATGYSNDTDVSLNGWVVGVSSTGTFVKHPDMTSLTIGVSGIPTGWTVEDDNPKSYFTIEAIEDGLTVSLSENASQYRIDNGDWVDLAASTATPSVNAGQKIQFKMENPSIASTKGIGTFTTSKQCNAIGNIMSLLYGGDFEDKKDLTGKNYAFCKLFYNNRNLVNAEKLILPATTLDSYCYQSMFEGCASLVSSPELPATTLAISCYRYMLEGCASLVSSPELPANTLADYCYGNMFKGCVGLTVAPTLPATTLYNQCYDSMFYGCTSLTVAPELPATRLTYYCYYSMFRGCAGLTVAPVLPATTLAEGCYYEMFRLCTGLTTAPELPATTLATSCYNSMFRGCTGLTVAPELPVTTLSNSCYNSMFYGCTGLTVAPELPATTLAESCYEYMFYNCSNLNNINMLAADVSATRCLYYWVKGVSKTGTFVKHPAMTSLPTGDSGIPTGWTTMNQTPCIINTSSTSIIFNYDEGLFTPNSDAIDLSNYLTKDNLLSIQPMCDIVVNLIDRNNNLYVSDYVWEYSKTLSDVLTELNITTDVYGISVVIIKVDEPEDSGYYYYQIDYSKEYFTIEAIEDGLTVSLSKSGSQYRIDNGDWVDLSANTSTPSVNAGQKIQFKMENTTSSSTGIGTFTTSKKFNVSGNIMSLLYGDNFEDENNLKFKTYVFSELFYNNRNLVNAENLILPATTLADSCYYRMFNGCTGLTVAPELPATVLSNGCYSFMFYGCTGLTVAPELPATTLANNCYSNMFYNCSNLKHIAMLASDISATNCLYNWVKGVLSSTGIFVKHPEMTSLPSGDSGIPKGWTVEDYNS